MRAGGFFYLTSIPTLAPEDTLRSNLQVRGVGIDNHWRLSAELERDGREVLCGGLGHDAAHNPISCVRDCNSQQRPVSMRTRFG